MKSKIFIIFLSICYICKAYPNDFIIDKAEITCTASSTLEGSAGKYTADHLFDNTTDTAWVEGDTGAGIGSFITVVFKEEKLIDRIYIKNGYGDYKYFYANNRVRELEIIFNTEESGSLVILKDKPGFQCIDLLNPTIVKKIIFKIRSVYRGEKYDDTCLSKIIFNSLKILNMPKFNGSIIKYYFPLIEDYIVADLKKLFSWFNRDDLIINKASRDPYDGFILEVQSINIDNGDVYLLVKIQIKTSDKISPEESIWGLYYVDDYSLTLDQKYLMLILETLDKKHTASIKLEQKKLMILGEIDIRTHGIDTVIVSNNKDLFEYYKINQEYYSLYSPAFK